MKENVFQPLSNNSTAWCAASLAQLSEAAPAQEGVSLHVKRLRTFWTIPFTSLYLYVVRYLQGVTYSIDYINNIWPILQTTYITSTHISNAANQILQVQAAV